MTLYELISRKQDGGELSAEEIEFIISGYTDGTIPDYQMSAFLMAVYFKGMTDSETGFLLKSMVNSGNTIDTSGIPGIKIDKHSTGGVGDKVSLILAPLVAAAGLPIPMISGRGLGHSGGTLDKLESIPGFNVSKTTDEFLKQVSDIGVAIISQSEDIVPADRKMYALRDVTATVRSIPLMAGSIMSKKIAEGIDALVLDVKTGKGAFLTDMEDSRLLAHTLVSIGKQAGIDTKALITDMSQPLGNAIGNWVEVVESLKCLKGEGPEDLEELTLTLGAHMLVLGKITDSIDEAYSTLKSLLQNGSAFDKFVKLVEAQNGDSSLLYDPDKYPAPKHSASVTADSTGFVESLDPYALGTASVSLGAGRLKQDDSLDNNAGIILHYKIGDSLNEGDILADVYSDSEEKLSSQLLNVKNAFEIGDAENAPPDLIKEVI
ncbi:MAG: thymidine phosphorylase [Candidatus Marinimicrobia bacterium]|nr:thymidine phosphorylase [Candidatus Neomarinimicrobiota bacterium]